MANTFSGLTAYVEERRFGLDFYKNALQTNDMIPFVQQVGMLIPSVKEDTIKLPNISATVGIADGATCTDDFDNGNDTTITQSSISLVKGKVSDSICMHGGDFETYFTAAGLPLGQKYTGLGALEAAIVDEIMRTLAPRIANNAWTGPTSPDSWTFNNSWMDLLFAATMGTFDASTNVNGGIVGSTTPTSGGSAGTDAQGVYNICEALVQAALTSKDFGSAVANGECYIVMSPLHKEYMRQNYQKRFGLAMPEIAVGLAGLQNGMTGAFNFPGWNVPVYTQSSLTGENCIILSRKGNQVLAVDTVGDFTSIDIWLADDHDTIRHSSRFKMGTGWRALNGRNIKYWGTTT